MTPDQWWATFALGMVIGAGVIIVFALVATAWRDARTDELVQMLKERDDGKY